MIEVEQLTKRYAGHTALRALSFSVKKGQIVGFLGPNGAGKSTTMRIMSTFMPPTSGRIQIAGYDVARKPMEVRKRIGYMPENNPLHLDMRVEEYLRFRAGLKGVSADRLRTRLGEVLELCDLTNVKRKIIGQMSKGYRQRVGVADAILHQPEVIILDEPTIGLDPHQVRLFRKLISSLATEHTVLLSTHILSEVELTCDRILILHDGKLLADDSKETIHRRLGSLTHVVAEIAAPWEGLSQSLEAMPSIADFKMEDLKHGFLKCHLTARDEIDIRPLLFEEIKHRGWTLRELTRQQPALEDLFVHLTHVRPNQKDV
ncbi:ABC transporter ATP-binding protein [Verrucomicrobia bacterium]|jgi:ABC-2 type transport system ATP-binding protein|nr:ABC transporter ATP-binding protein [Verrucomicrobiota bacterium]MDA7665622.1 ABC transporter ATP-binding protein [Verrucomicrobiota bacterium]MDB4350811.1 ABC transporter ATP-binding protein [Verrucomicrobiota bacterium]MDB4777147.1 ABC transporter ATP-binding protein [Verrucomicrobiota bacterium]MDC0264371.1 ABC transporter ATP-binding protein [Verrucomicrobiota bacterium]